jgi:hypothetical protein
MGDVSERLTRRGPVFEVGAVYVAVDTVARSRRGETMTMDGGSCDEHDNGNDDLVIHCRQLRPSITVFWTRVG